MKRNSAVVAIAVTLHQLLANHQSDFGPEQELVLDALRRSKSDLADASVEALADYLKTMEPEQLAGVARNVKGIFHELLVVRAENQDGDGISALLKEATNFPGADVEFVVDGETVREVQVKAVQSADALREHFKNYPDLEVIATDEVVASLDGAFSDRVQSSGFENADLANTTQMVFDDLTADDVSAVLSDDLSDSVLVLGALQARAVLAGTPAKPKEMRELLQAAGIAASTALTVDVLLGTV